MKYDFNDLSYELIKDEDDIFDYNDIKSLLTDYFNPYDYILGDRSYSKIRLKGFCDKKNKLFRDINDYGKIDSYIKNYCASNCSYFVLKKIKKD